MSKLPDVQIDGLVLSDIFFNFDPRDHGGIGVEGDIVAAREFIQIHCLEEQVAAEDLVADYKARL